MNLIYPDLASLSSSFRSSFVDSEGTKAWYEDEVLKGKRVKARVLILDTKGCYWALKNGGCTMCGYVHNPHKPEKTPSEQFEENVVDGTRYVKVFNSGSFFDDSEISKDERKRIFSIARDKGVEKLLIETRPEFITPRVSDEISTTSSDMDVTVAIGLESASDFVRINMINKGFLFSHYTRAVKMLKEAGARVKTYLLLKPPFMSEKEAYLDALSSIEATLSLSDEISINPVNIQSGTLVNDLFRRGYYRPPWIWTLLKVMIDGIDMAKEMDLNVRIMTSTSGGGTRRGVHNCGRCDKNAMRMLDKLSIDYYLGDNGVVEEARKMLSGGCECLKLWKLDMDGERYPYPDFRDMIRG